MIPTAAVQRAHSDRARCGSTGINHTTHASRSDRARSASTEGRPTATVEDPLAMTPREAVTF